MTTDQEAILKANIERAEAIVEDLGPHNGVGPAVVHGARIVAGEIAASLRGLLPAPPPDGRFEALSETHPSDCQSCCEGDDPCPTHRGDWRYWEARALDAEQVLMEQIPPEPQAPAAGSRAGLERLRAAIEAFDATPWTARPTLLDAHRRAIVVAARALVAPKEGG